MDSLLNFKNFYDEITATTKKLEKAAILEKYKDDEDVKFYLNYLLNPYITTGISDKKLARPVIAVGNFPMFAGKGTMKIVFEYISKNNTGSDNMLAFYFHHASKLPVGLHQLANKIVSKNLPMGIDAKSVNKVISGLIPTFDVMLANKYFDKPEVALNKEFVLTTKIDGGRIIAIKKNGEAKFYTRQGQEYEGLVDLKKEMEEKFPDNICLDGELVAINTTKEDTYKNTMKISRTKDAEKHGLKMLVFDYMSASNFEIQNCPVKYIDRYSELSAIMDLAESVFFERLPMLYKGTDVNKITEILNEQIAKGEEGIMINFTDQPYVFSRTNALLKVKKMKDLDLECIGFEEGTNRHEGRLGALLVNYDGYTVKVGNGLSDELRTEIWNNRDEWLGRTIVVQYFEETYNAKEGKSLRFPVYIDYREDK